MRTIKPLTDFDPDYLQKLKAGLLPALKRYSGWVAIEQLAENAELFVEAVYSLIRQGYFEDYRNNLRLDISADERRVRYIPDSEAAMIVDLKLNYEKSAAIPELQ